MQQTDKFDHRGTQAFLLGQEGTNIAWVWNQERDRVERVTGAVVSEETVSLKNPDLLLATQAYAKNNQDREQIISSHNDLQLRPSKGFSAHIAEPTNSRNIPRTLTAAMH